MTSSINKICWKDKCAAILEQVCSQIDRIGKYVGDTCPLPPAGGTIMNMPLPTSFEKFCKNLRFVHKRQVCLVGKNLPDDRWNIFCGNPNKICWYGDGLLGTGGDALSVELISL